MRSGTQTEQPLSLQHLLSTADLQQAREQRMQISMVWSAPC